MLLMQLAIQLELQTINEMNVSQIGFSVFSVFTFEL